MTTERTTIVLARPTPQFYDESNEVIGTIPAGETRPVRVLHYGKDYLMLEVELIPGTVGYVDAANVKWSAPR